MQIKSVKNDIDGSIKLIKNRRDKINYSKYSCLYSFTTENIKGYYHNFSFKNKKVLTICGSGDHILNAILLGATDITTFDINKLTYYYLHLKIGAVKTLSYEKFIDYFMLNNKDECINEKAFSYQTYLLIREHLSSDVKQFWDNIYNSFNNEGHSIRISNLFNNKYDTFSNKVKYNIYLDQDKYLVLKKNIEFINIDYICVSFQDITLHTIKKFDYIFMSNVSDYIKDIYEYPYLDKYKTFITEELSKLLNKNGVIFLAYIYDFNINNSDGRTDIDVEEKRKSVFNEKYFSTILFESAINKEKDGIIMFKGGTL
ncbi:MAG: DUF3419 family protein [Bacilli bacterium]|nr:DUF3419 family protein [Bacilli bacterium]